MNNVKAINLSHDEHVGRIVKPFLMKIGILKSVFHSDENLCVIEVETHAGTYKHNVKYGTSLQFVNAKRASELDADDTGSTVSASGLMRSKIASITHGGLGVFVSTDKFTTYIDDNEFVQFYNHQLAVNELKSSHIGCEITILDKTGILVDFGVSGQRSFRLYYIAVRTKSGMKVYKLNAEHRIIVHDEIVVSNDKDDYEDCHGYCDDELPY